MIGWSSLGWSIFFQWNITYTPKSHIEPSYTRKAAIYNFYYVPPPPKKKEERKKKVRKEKKEYGALFVLLLTMNVEFSSVVTQFILWSFSLLVTTGNLPSSSNFLAVRIIIAFCNSCEYFCTRIVFYTIFYMKQIHFFKKFQITQKFIMDFKKKEKNTFTKSMLQKQIKTQANFRAWIWYSVYRREEISIQALPPQFLMFPIFL